MASQRISATDKSKIDSLIKEGFDLIEEKRQILSSILEQQDRTSIFLNPGELGELSNDPKIDFGLIVIDVIYESWQKLGAVVTIEKRQSRLDGYYLMKKVNQQLKGLKVAIEQINIIN